MRHAHLYRPYIYVTLVSVFLLSIIIYSYTRKEYGVYTNTSYNISFNYPLTWEYHPLGIESTFFNNDIEFSAHFTKGYTGIPQHEIIDRMSQGGDVITQPILIGDTKGIRITWGHSDTVFFSRKGIEYSFSLLRNAKNKEQAEGYMTMIKSIQFVR